tara:strand:+ start:477 stop:626 length:150 start_codon:yes stop_codon:yes gene_type:complete
MNKEDYSPDFDYSGNQYDQELDLALNPHGKEVFDPETEAMLKNFNHRVF